ncbi:MAG: hypothetical protein L0228_03105 [Planctomycetes bacterium]|nr:hypothetical protein [Planctomycetota bacterium]
MPMILTKTSQWVSRSAAILGIAGGLGVFYISGRTALAELVAVEAQADVFVVNNAAPAGIQQQFRGQFEPMLKVELSFANRACKLTDDERRTLITKSNAWLTKFIADYAKQGGQPQQHIWFGGGRQQPADPRTSIEEGVAKIVTAELPKEKAAVYADECKKRSEFSQKMAVDNLVVRIDKELVLSPEQREKLTKSLSEHWDKSWAPQLEMFMHGMDIWPNVPDQWIRPHLTAAQQVAWGRLNKQSGHMFFGGFGMEGQVIDDIDLKEGDHNSEEAEPAALVDPGAPPRPVAKQLQ